MDEINEQTENMKQIQEALATPIGAAADFDEVIKPLYPLSNAQTTFAPCYQGKDSVFSFSDAKKAQLPYFCCKW
jgi:hypothetical protein